MRVAVAGGTGLVGAALVQLLEEQGHHPVTLARSAGVDVITGAGLDAALEDADSVVDVTNVTTLSRAKATAFFGTATDNLVAAAHQAGVRHHVVLSIVGVDRVDTGYYAGKRQQEDRALAGPVPVTVLRATQFHEFAAQILDRGRRGPLAFVPRMRTQPVDVAEVVTVLADLAVGPALGRAPDLGGPQVHQLPDLVRRVARARGENVRVVPVPVPGAAGTAMARDGLLTGPGARISTKTFDEWLAQTSQT